MTSTNPIVETVIDTLTEILPAKAMLHEPKFGGNEWEYVKECLDSGWVSSAGAYVEKFEGMLVSTTGARHAIATVNGTAALHTALILTGVKAGDEVISPALTFIGTTNAIAQIGAIPHFADSEERTLGLDPVKLGKYLANIADVSEDGCRNKESGRRIAAVICVHIFGHPVDLDALTTVCKKFNLILIEDAAESLGSLYKGRHTGNHGRISVLSFNGNKTITTGGGGAILTNDSELAKSAKHLTTTAKLAHAWEYRHDQVGFNYRLPNINAALGCAQLEKLPEFLSQKRRLAKNYMRAFTDVRGLRFITEPDFAKSNYWLNALLLDSENANLRDEILVATNDNHIMTRPAWVPMHQLPMFKGCPRMSLGVAEDLYRRLINIPSSPGLAS